MNRERTGTRSMGMDAGAAFFSVLVIASMFLTYVTLKLVSTTTSGFKLLENEGSSANPFLIISIILSASIVVFSVLRLIRFPLFNTRLFSLIYGAAGLALLGISIALMVTVVKINIGGGSFEVAKRGVGVILNLVFSILVAACCIGSYTNTDNRIAA